MMKEFRIADCGLRIDVVTLLRRALVRRAAVEPVWRHPSERKLAARPSRAFE